MTTLKRRFFLYAILPAVFIGFWIASPKAKAAETSGFTPILIENISVTRQLDLLQAICEPGQVTMRAGAPTCNTCPPYTSGGPAGLRITNAIESNFTRPGASEVLVDTTGCEPASGGGSVLLEADKRGWSRILYRAGFRSNECVRFRTLKQTVSLACNMSSIDQGIQRGKLEWLSLRDGKPTQQSLLDWYDNSQSNPRRLVSIFPHRFMKSDFNSDGRVDLQVNVRVRDETVPAKYPSFVDAVAAGHRFKKAGSLRLVYLFDGSTLVLSPNSEAAKTDIDALLEQTRDH
jgi:hypothetical protein